MVDLRQYLATTLSQEIQRDIICRIYALCARRCPHDTEPVRHTVSSTVFRSDTLLRVNPIILPTTIPRGNTIPPFPQFPGWLVEVPTTYIPVLLVKIASLMLVGGWLLHHQHTTDDDGWLCTKLRSHRHTKESMNLSCSHTLPPAWQQGSKRTKFVSCNNHFVFCGFSFNLW